MINLILTVRDRLDFTKKTVDSLRPALPASLRLWCVDNGSGPDTITYLRQLRKDNVIHWLATNAAGTVPQWEKCYAISQAWAAMKGTIAATDYIGWIDNDIVVRSSWTSIPSSVLSLATVDVCSLHNDPFQEGKHKTRKVVPIDNLRVRIKETANGAFWVMRHDFFQRYGLPPVGKGVGMGGVEDWFYSNLLRRSGRKFGVVDGISTHLGYTNSMRKRVKK